VWQVVQRKVDIPIVDKATCQTKVKAALNAKKAGVGDKVTISPSEVSTSLPLPLRVSKTIVLYSPVQEYPTNILTF
jgi:hypothetical protein